MGIRDAPIMLVIYRKNFLLRFSGSFMGNSAYVCSRYISNLLRWSCLPGCTNLVLVGLEVVA